MTIRFLSFLVLSSIIISLYSSCGNEGRVLPGSTGKVGEILIVYEQGVDTATVDSIESILTAELYGLPQPEPLFDPITVHHRNFSSMLNIHRNILLIREQQVEKPTLKKRYEVWAENQLVIQLTANSDEEILSFFKTNSESVINQFNTADRMKLVKGFKETKNLKIEEQLILDHGFSLSIPEEYFLAKDTPDNFIWIRKETEKTSRGVLIFYDDYKSDSMLTRSYMTNLIDSMGKKHVPGPNEGSYFGIEQKYPVQAKEVNFNDMYALELRGLWTVVNGFMGGPFVSYTFVDEKRNRAITLMAFVFAPSEEKRPIIREMEGILHTFEIR